MKPTRVLYLDLDGTVRKGYDELGRFVNAPEDVEIFPEALEMMQRFQLAGWRLVAITNQGGVALGHMSVETARKVMEETNNKTNLFFDMMSMCMHHPDAKDPEMAICWCRKPRAGLIIEAAISMGKVFNEYYPPHLALFVGDRPEDEAAAEAANIRFASATDWRAGHIEP